MRQVHAERSNLPFRALGVLPQGKRKAVGLTVLAATAGRLPSCAGTAFLMTLNEESLSKRVELTAEATMLAMPQGKRKAVGRTVLAAGMLDSHPEKRSIGQESSLGLMSQLCRCIPWPRRMPSYP